MRTEYQEQAKVFKALCDPKRLSILEQLRSGECQTIFGLLLSSFNMIEVIPFYFIA